MNWIPTASALVIAVLGLVGSQLITKRQLDASRPMTAAQTLDIGIGTVNKVMDSLRRQLDEYEERVRELTATVAEVRKQCDVRVTENETIILTLQKRLNLLETELEDAHEQVELMTQQLDTAHETVTALRQQNKILRERLRLLQGWVSAYYDAKNPNGQPPPPDTKHVLETPDL